MSPVKVNSVSCTKQVKAPAGSQNALDSLSFSSDRFDIYEYEGDVYVSHKSNLEAMIRIPAGNLIRVEYFNAADSPIARFLTAPDGPGDAPEVRRGPGRPPKHSTPVTAQ